MTGSRTIGSDRGGPRKSFQDWCLEERDTPSAVFFSTSAKYLVSWYQTWSLSVINLSSFFRDLGQDNVFFGFRVASFITSLFLLILFPESTSLLAKYATLAFCVRDFNIFRYNLNISSFSLLGLFLNAF